MDIREKCKVADDVYRSLTKTIKELSECHESQIPVIEKKIEKWPFFRTAFSVWALVFSRFENTMSVISAKYELENFQSAAFSEKDKEIILSILKILIKIWDNSYDRNSHNFLDLMKDYLCSTDFDVLSESLRLTFRAARRLRNQRSCRAFNTHLLSQIKEIAGHWQIQEDQIDIPLLCRDDTIITPKNKSLNFWFYKVPQKTNAQFNIYKSLGSSPLNLHEHFPSKTNLSTKFAKDDMLQPVADGPILINITEAELSSKSVSELVSQLTTQYEIPSNFKYSLFWKLLVTKHISNPEARRKLLSIKFLAVGLIFTTYGSEFLKPELFVYEPNLITNMSELLKINEPEHENIKDIQQLRLSTLVALGCFFYHKGKLFEVLSSLSAWAYHGTLASLFRNVVHTLSLNENKYSQEFVNELFGLVFLLKNSNINGDPIVSGGYIQTLVKHIENTNVKYYGSISRAIVILDAFISYSPNVIDVFVPTKGFNTIVRRISEEVEWFVSKGRDETNVDDGSSEFTFDDTIATRVTFLRSLLKFTLSLMQNNSFSENTRSLMDSSLPHSILSIFENVMCFTSGMLFLAINIMSTTIHNDPTSLTVLQEMKIPQTLLSKLLEKTPVSSEIIPSLPGVFGTTCLNQAGLDYFTNNVDLLRKFILILSSEVYIDLIDNGDIAYTIGEHLDEFIRHNPSLSQSVSNAIFELLEQISLKFKIPHPDDPLNYRLNLPSDYARNSHLPPDLEKPCTPIRYVNVVSRFLDGFLCESGIPHSPLVDKTDIITTILQCYLSPSIPYNFASTTTTSLIVYILKFINDNDFFKIIEPIIQGTTKLINDMTHLVIENAESNPISKTVIDLSSASEEQIENAQKVLRCFIDLDAYISMFLCMVTNYYVRNGGGVIRTVQLINEGVHETKTSTLSTINSIIICERIKIMDDIPNDWLEICNSMILKEKNKEIPEKSPYNMFVNIFGSIPSFIFHSSNIYSVLKNCKDNLGCSDKYNDPVFKHKFKNSTMFLYLFSRIPMLTVVLFEAVLKYSTFRKHYNEENRLTAVNFVKNMAQYFCSQLAYSKFGDNDEKLKLKYFSTVISCLAMTLFDAREENIQLTVLGPAFAESGGIKILSSLLMSMWTTYVKTGTSENRDEKFWLLINSSISSLLNLLLCMTSIENIKAGKLTRLYGEPQENNASQGFDANEYISKVMVDLSEPLLIIWKSPSFMTVTTPLVQFLIIQIVINIVCISHHKPPASNTRQVAWNLQVSPGNCHVLRHRSSFVVPDEAKIQQLTEMGFSREASSMALSRCNNDVGNAAEYLITHHISSEPDLVPPTGQVESSSTILSAESVGRTTEPTTEEHPRVITMNSSLEPIATTLEFFFPNKPDLSENSKLRKNSNNASQSSGIALSQTAISRAKIVKEFTENKIEMALEILKHKPSLFNQVFSFIKSSSTDNNIYESIEELEKHASETLDLVNDDLHPKREAFIFSLWNILALSLKVSVCYKYKVPTAEEFIVKIYNNLEKVANYSPRILCHLLLVLDTYLVYYNKILNLCPDDYQKQTVDDVRNSILNDRNSLIDILLRIFPHCSKNPDTYNAAFLLILRLADDHNIAVRLLNSDFFSIAFNTKTLAIFPNQMDLLMLLVRKIFEDNFNLKIATILELEKITYSYRGNNGKQFLRSFIKTHLCNVRNTEIFCDVVPIIFKISFSSPNPFNNKHYASIALNWPASDQPKTENSEEAQNQDDNAEDDNTKKYMSFLERYNSLSENPVKFEALYDKNNNEHCIKMFDLLTNELFNCDNELNQKINMATQSAISESRKSDASSGKSSSKPEIDAQSFYEIMLLSVKIRYILTMITEVLTSYPFLSVHLLPNVVKKVFKNLPVQNSQSRSVDNSLLNYAVNTFLGDWTNTSRTKNDIHSLFQNKKFIISDAASSLLLNLIKFSDTWEPLQNYCLQYIISSNSIDYVVKILKTALSTPDLSTDTLFSIYTFICHLAHDLTVGASHSRFRPISKNITLCSSLKELIDRGFVSCVTQVIKDIDIYNPKAKLILPFIIESLSSFTIAAYKYGEVIEPEAFENDKNSLENLIKPDGDSEIYNTYNNSSLQIYGYSQSGSENDQDGDCSDVETLNSIENEEYLSNESDSPEDSGNNDNDPSYNMSVDYSDMDVNLIVSQRRSSQTDDTSEGDTDDTDDDDDDDDDVDADDVDEGETEDDLENEVGDGEVDNDEHENENAVASDENNSLSPCRNSLSEYAIDDTMLWENTPGYDENSSRRRFPILRTIGLRYDSLNDRGNYRVRNIETADNYPEINILDDNNTHHSRDFDDVTRAALGLNTNNSNASNVAHIDVGLQPATRILRLDSRRGRRHMTSVIGNHVMEIINMTNDSNIEYNLLESGDANNGVSTDGLDSLGPRYCLPISYTASGNGGPNSYIHPLLRKCSAGQRFAIPKWISEQSEHNNSFEPIAKIQFEVPCTVHHMGNEFGYPIWVNTVCFTEFDEITSLWENSLELIESHLSYRRRLREKVHVPVTIYDPDNIPIVDRILSLRNFKLCTTSDRWIRELFFRYGENLTARSIQIEKLLLELTKNTNCTSGTQEADNNDYGEKADQDGCTSEPERKRPRQDIDFPDINTPTVLPNTNPDNEPRINDDQFLTNENGVVSFNGNRLDLSRNNIDVEFLSALPQNLRHEMLTHYMFEASRGAASGREEDSVENPFNNPPAFPGLTLLLRNRQLLHRANSLNTQNPPSQIAAPPVGDEAESSNNQCPSNNNGVFEPPANLPTNTGTQDENTSNSRENICANSNTGSAPVPMDVDPNDTCDTNQVGTRVAETNVASSRKHSINISNEAPVDFSYSGGALMYDLSQFSSETDSYLRHRRKIFEINNSPGSNKEAINIFDKQSVAALLRLLFLPEPIARNDLHLTFINACENSTTNRDIMLILLTILYDEINDFQSMDKLISNIISKHHNKLPSSSQQKRHSSKISSVPPQCAENVPNLILRRCLDLLVYLLSNNKVLKFFLTEDENFVNKILQNSKRFNRIKMGKSNSSILRRPVILLFKLLERYTFLSNAALTELIMFILVSILQPITLLKDVNKNAKLNEKNSPDESNTEWRGILGMSNEGNVSAEGYLQDISEFCMGSQVIDSTNPSSFTDNKISLPRLDTRNMSGKDYRKTFDLPSHYIKLISNVLVNDVCSRKTFQCTISLIHTICLICNNVKQVTNSLMSVVGSLANALVTQFESLNKKLKECNSILEVNDSMFSKFASPSSDQAKLLRVLKTADFIHYKTSSTNSQNSTDKEYSESKCSESKEQTGHSPEYELIMSYRDLKLSKLWSVFSELLTTIGSCEDLTNTATVLLPLIESFMIIMKPYVMCKEPYPDNGDGMDSNINNKELFFRFTEEHKRMLNAMIWKNSSLMNGSFSLLIQNTKILDFENKCYYFHQQLHKRTDVDPITLQINVRRKYIFEDSYHQMRGYSGDEIKYGNICVSFYKEEGVDAGGLSREWFSALARQMFNPDYALFRPSANDKVTYQPNRLSYVNNDHLMYFKFVGTIIGKAIFDKHLLDAYFTRSFYKAMIDSPVDIKDMEAVDPEFYKSLEWILNNDITDVLDLTLCTEIDEFGKKKIIELVPKGSQIPVTEENKHKYVKLIVEQHLYLNIKTQIDSFMSGLYEIIPKELLKIFNEQELELLISGLPDIDIDDWKNNTEYHNYTSSSPQIIWFWRTVRSFTQEERAKLLQFCTGTSKVPLEGLQGFQIHRDFSATNRLPSAHTCFNQLDLPAYESYEILRKYVILAISEGNVGFGFA